ncbi:unnamed protein product [Didymodactylos carnosus]|uniref:Beta-1,4-galactosyltransferase n=1 Tax=Didymodactylos carnosus TaxID=1234261 RepID=A0A813VHC9_9BILA|nr:unnamed protein product [Didymodactylos carnosus]CAF1057389.1 unnamed protein product [Didymodactylos carnosus]CAF3629094.1 unnamed protein product [Didymodactylos carnosus]CAF3823363.1 unnamed protein product [Didymodactylos carnosus]
MTVTVTIETLPFLNASYSNTFSYPNETYYQLPFCNISTDIRTSPPNSTSHRVTINHTIFDFSDIEQSHFHTHTAGHWWPTQCQSEQRLAVIVCYRRRQQHLKLFLNNIHPFLQRQQLDYTLFVVNQHGTNLFNRAALFNVGYIEAMKLYNYTCFIFHDVDLLPEDNRNLYECGTKPRHMSVAVDKFNYKLSYAALFGGVTAFQQEDFLAASGYPTVYQGWGGEDDDMYNRVTKKLKKNIVRYPIGIARYKMIRSMGHVASKLNPYRHKILYSKYNYSLDGVKNTEYKLNELKFYNLFILVNVTLNELTWDEIKRKLRIKG